MIENSIKNPREAVVIVGTRTMEIADGGAAKDIVVAAGSWRSVAAYSKAGETPMYIGRLRT